MQKLSAILLILVASIWVPACGQKSSFDDMVSLLYKNTVPLIEPYSLSNQKKSVYLLDIRSPEEYEVSHIRGARLVDYESFDKAAVADIPKDAEIVVYCSVGLRSENVGEQLQELDYANVSNLYGGIFNWKNEGYTVVNTQNQPTDSVHAYSRLWGQWLNNAIKVYE